MKSVGRITNFALIIVVLGSITLSLLRFNSFQTGTWIDDAHYVMLAKSIASGQGYHNIYNPDSPSAFTFPPGWPLLLFPLVSVFPDTFVPLKLFAFALWLVSIFLMYRFFASRIKRPYLEILIALTILNPMLVGISVMVMSEAAYSFLSFLFFNLVDRLETLRDHALKGNKIYIIAAIGIVAFYCQLLRTIGLTIVLSLLIYLLFTRQFKVLLITAVVIVLGLIPQYAINSQGGGSIITSANQTQYIGCANEDGCSVVSKVGHMVENAGRYLNAMVSNSVFPVFGDELDRILGRFGLNFISQILNLVILAAIGFGYIRSFKWSSVIHIYTAVYFVALLPFVDLNQGGAQARYLIPLVPFFYYYIMLTAQALARLPLLQRKFVPYAASLLVAFIVLVMIGRNFQDVLHPIRERITDISVGYSWINENAPKEAIIMASDPVPDFLYAKRKVVAYPGSELEMAVEDYIAEQRVSFIVISPKLQTPRTTEIDPFVESNLLRYLVANADKFKQVYQNVEQNVTVYQVIRE